MNIDATFWVAISFFIFLGGLIYLKVPQKINDSLNGQINNIKKELDEAEKLKEEAKNLLSDYEGKIDKSDIPWGTDGYKPATSDFIDGISYDGKDPLSYLKSHKIGHKF